MKYDIGYITQYMLEYDSGVPISICILILLSVCGIIIILYQNSFDGPSFFRNSFKCILGGYLFFIFCTTVLFRDGLVEEHPALHPLWSYSVLYSKLLAEILLNILMFIPIGFIVSASLKKRNMLKIIGLGCCISLMIEILQFVTKRGVFNIDDIIHNSLGCAIGYILFLVCHAILIKHLE